MPSTSHANSPSKPRKSALIVALSGRALAAAARRAGDTPIVIDLFADVDTRSYAETCVRLSRGPAGFDRATLCDTVAALRSRAGGLIYGAGLEADADLLGEIGTLVPLIGNPPSIVAAVKQPFRFAALLDHLGIPHPETRSTPPVDGRWLRKQAGASGGSHIGWGVGSSARAGTYFQKQVAGRSLSALFVADGRDMRMIGCSEQWSEPTETQPFRYGGCAGPVTLPSRLTAKIEEACRAIVWATGLRGLNGLDMIVDGDQFYVLEVNPRPGATLDVFDHSRLPLWRYHCLATRGFLPPVPDVTGPMRAAAVLYAPSRLTMLADKHWPRWMADRSTPGTVFERGDPICTIRASARTVAEARTILAERAQYLLGRLGEPPRQQFAESYLVCSAV